MLKQTQQLKLQQKLSPQQIQLMKLVQLPLAALEQRIKEELEINPALEEGKPEEEQLAENEFEEQDNNEFETDAEHSREDFNLDEYIDDDEIPSYKLTISNSSPDEERKEIPYAGGISFQEQLIEQLRLRNLNEKEFKIASYLIGNLDDDGYLRRELSAMVDDLAFTQGIITNDKEVEQLLKVVQSLDPPGIGARNLQECLLLQLQRKELQYYEVKIATKIIETCMEEFSKKHYDKIQRKLNITEEELKEAIQEIIKLNPKPGNSIADNSRNIEQITPDFILSNNDGILEVSLHSRNMPALRVNKEYTEMLDSYARSREKNKSQKEAASFVKQKIDSAHWFIDAIEQRNQTLLHTMNAILDFQREYFLDGDETKLKPMILKDIADKVGIDISTVSRVVNSKYIQTPFGTFPLKSFFSESLSTESGDEVSTREVKKILSDIIENEDKSNPVTDDELAQLLKKKGYNIARRTVAKYREQLNIPVARLRKQI
jgi:RNA polymerase sigma-54 factor